jgi:hypothetical protein
VFLAEFNQTHDARRDVMPHKSRDEKAPAIVLFGKDEKSKPHASYFDEADLAGATKAAELMQMRVLKITTDEHRTTAAELPRGRVFASGKAFVPFVGKTLYQRLLILSGSAEGADRGKNPLNRTDPKNGSEMAPCDPLSAPENRLGVDNRAKPAPMGRFKWPRAEPGVAAERVSAQPGADIAPRAVQTLGPAGAGPPQAPHTGPAQPGAANPAGSNADCIGPGSLVLATVAAGEAWWESDVVAVNDNLLTLKWRDFPDEPIFVRQRSRVALLHPSQQPAAINGQRL